MKNVDNHFYKESRLYLCYTAGQCECTSRLRGIFLAEDSERESCPPLSKRRLLPRPNRQNSPAVLFSIRLKNGACPQLSFDLLRETQRITRP